jgi:hypothetical protein
MRVWRLFFRAQYFLLIFFIFQLDKIYNIKAEGEFMVDRSLKFKILEKFRFQADLVAKF